MTSNDRLSHTPQPPPASPACCGFVPPYLIRQIAASSGSRRLMATGEGTLAVDARLRRRRETADASTTPVAPDTSGNRVIFDAQSTEQLPGTPVRGADDPPTGDAAVDEAHEWTGQSWDLFETQFDRRSVDGVGTPLTVTVHFGRDYENAFWDGTQLVFGDGDGEIFDRFTKPIDVAAHEFTHGVTQFSAGLVYAGQPGALNESVSDVFAALVKQRALGQTAEEADWLIGVGLFMPDVQARALRSMTEPGTAYDDPRLGRDPQVGSMAEFIVTEEDNGGVHLNSGIPNRAFALAARGIGGPSWEKAGRVWYDAITSGEVRAETDFAGFAEATLESAARLFPDEPAVAEQVRLGWQTVGLLGGPALVTGTPSSPAPMASGGQRGGGAEERGGGAGVPALPGEAGAELVAVRRSGGFAGTTRFGELDLDADPYGSELRRLLDQISVSDLSPSDPQPDRFVYTVACRSWELTVPEQDLTPELSRVVQIVLDQGGLR